MNLLSIFVVCIAIILAGLYATSLVLAGRTEAQFPPVGKFADIDVNGETMRLHYVDIPATENADLPPLVFVHGASGNLNDQMGAFSRPLKERARMLFVDRPGHGYSARGGDDMHNPEHQAKAILGLIDHLGIQQPIIVGHSFGGAIVAALAINHQKRLSALMFLAPATHPWPGGVSWYYSLANTPVIGWIFTNFLAIPAGMLRYENAVKGVFAPNRITPDYFEVSATRLALRPDAFHFNARDVDELHGHVVRMSRRYPDIELPTTIITGDSDDIVYAHIHSTGLEQDIHGAKLVMLKNVGHKPDYVATERIIEELEMLAIRSGEKFASSSSAGR